MIKTIIKILLIFSLAYEFSMEYAWDCRNLDLRAATRTLRQGLAG
jgi:hypothetical protein